MRKKIIISLIFIITCLLSYSVSFATIDYSGNLNINNLKAYVLENDATSFNDTNEKIINSSQTINGRAFKNVIYLEGKNTDRVKIVFGLNTTCLFGIQTTKPVTQEIFRANSSNPVKKSNEGTFTNSGVTVSTGKIAVNVSYGEYKGACGLTVEFTNKVTSDKWAAYTITLTDVTGTTRLITLVTKAIALDEDDISDVGTGDENYKEFVSGSALKNGYTIFVNTLKEMVGKGNYKFSGENGINIISSISQETVNAGKIEYKVTISTDSTLDSRYNSDISGKIIRLSCPFLHLENRKININCSNSKIIDLLGSNFIDKIMGGSIERLYVYPINDKSTIIGTAIESEIIDGTIQFTISKNVQDVIISSTKIDTTSTTIGNFDKTIMLNGPFLTNKKLEVTEVTDKTVIDKLYDKAKELDGKIVMLKDISVIDVFENKINYETEGEYQLIFDITETNIPLNSVLIGLHYDSKTGNIDTYNAKTENIDIPKVKTKAHIVNLEIGFRFSPYALVLIEQNQKDTTPKTGLKNNTPINELYFIIFATTVLIINFTKICLVALK